MYLLNHCRIVIQPLIPDTWPVAGRENLRRLVALMNINRVCLLNASSTTANWWFQPILIISPGPGWKLKPLLNFDEWTSHNCHIWTNTWFSRVRIISRMYRRLHTKNSKDSAITPAQVELLMFATCNVQKSSKSSNKEKRDYFEGVNLVLKTQSTCFNHFVFVTHSSQTQLIQSQSWKRMMPKSPNRWWLNQPIWKICASQIGSFPQG